MDRWVQHRDAEAFAEIVSRHAGMVFATCRRILRNSAEAEDVAQDCFFRLVTIRASAYPLLAEWLHKLATYRSLDRLRQTRRRKSREDQFARSVSVHTEPDWNEVEPYVDEAIAALPDEVRVIVVRHFLEGRSYSELAESLDLPRSTLARRCQQGIGAIRESLCKRGITTASAGLAAVLVRNAVEAAPETLLARLGKMALAGTTRAAAEAVPATVKTLMLGGTVVSKKLVIAAVMVTLGFGMLYEARAPILRGIRHIADTMRGYDSSAALRAVADEAAPPVVPDSVSTKSSTLAAEKPSDRKPAEKIGDQELAAALLQGLGKLAAAKKAAAGKSAPSPFRSEDIPPDNGAHYFLLAVELMPDLDPRWVGDMLEQIRANGWSDDPKLLALLDSCKESLDAIREGLKVGNAMMPRLSAGPEEPLPHLAKFRTLARVMDLEAQMYAAHGDYDAAIDKYSNLLGFATESSHGGLLIGQLVGYSMSNMAVEDIRNTLETSALSPEQYRDFAGRIQTLQSSQFPLSESVKMEGEDFAAWFHNSFEDPADFQAYVTNPETGYDETTRNMISQATPLQVQSMMEEMLNAYREYTPYFSLPYYEAQASDIESLVGNNPMARAVLAGMENVPATLARFNAELTGTALVAAIECFKAENGVYPASLDAIPAGLLAQAPKDPFTGGSFRYELTESGYLLYSTGSDMRDDGGVKNDWDADGGDLVIHD